MMMWWEALESAVLPPRGRQVRGRGGNEKAQLVCQRRLAPRRWRGLSTGGVVAISADFSRPFSAPLFLGVFALLDRRELDGLPAAHMETGRRHFSLRQISGGPAAVDGD